MKTPSLRLQHRDVCGHLVHVQQPRPGGWPGWPWRKYRRVHPGQARYVLMPDRSAYLAVMVAVAMCACTRGQAADPVALVAKMPGSSRTRDRLPGVEATVNTPEAQEDGRARCESQRQMICNQAWVGADEKCQRSHCELIAGFWLLRDPGQSTRIDKP